MPGRKGHRGQPASGPVSRQLQRGHGGFERGVWSGPVSVHLVARTMGHIAGSSVRLQRLSALVAIALVAIAVGFAFGRILDGHGATYRMIAVGLASGVLAWVTERRGMLIATIVSAAGLLLTITWLAVPHTTWFALPTATSVRSLGTLATLVGAQAREYVSPAPATPALVMASVIAVWAAVFSCYALAFRAQSPLLALIPPLALVVFADSVLDDTIKPIYGVLFLVAALAVLFADSLRRIRAWGPVWSPIAGRDRLLPVAGRNARWVGASALVMAVLAPLLLPGFGTTSLLDISHLGGDHRVSVSPLVQMGSRLTDPKYNVPFFQVKVSPPRQQSDWRMESLDYFDGNTWEALPDNGAVTQVENGTIPNASEAGRSVTQTFTMLNDLGYSWLVSGGNEPTQISIGHDVAWHATSSSLTMDGWPNDGESYTVTSTYVNPTPHQLRVAGVAADPADLQQPTDPAMAIPASVKKPPCDGPRTQTPDTTRSWPSCGTSRRSTASLMTPTWTSRTTRRRSRTSCKCAGILPTVRGSHGGDASVPRHPRTDRIGVHAGYAGERSRHVHRHRTGLSQLGRGAVQRVRVRNVRPHPNFPDLSSTQYATGTKVPKIKTCKPGTPRCETGPGDGMIGHHHHHETTGGEGGTATQVGPPAEQVTTGPAISKSEIALAVVAGALLAVIAFLLRGLRRRRRLHAANDPRTLILTAYDVFADRARELGVGRAPGDTLDEFRDRLVATDRLSDADRPLVRMTSEVERAAYSASPPDAASAQEVSRDAEAVLQALRNTTPFRQRMLGHYRNEQGPRRGTRRIGSR